MAIKAIHECDGCGQGLEEGDYVYCDKCCGELQEEIASLKDDIDVLNDEITALEEEKK